MSDSVSFDDFFDKVDQSLANEQAVREKAEAEKPAKQEFVEQAVRDAALLAASYRDALQKRGIKMEISSSKTGISATLHYNNGRKTSLHMSKAITGDHLEIWTIQPNREKADFRSTDGASYRQNNYTGSIFSEKLQRFIDSYLFEAKFHQGTR